MAALEPQRVFIPDSDTEEISCHLLIVDDVDAVVLRTRDNPRL